jgi:hypothetical protein
MRAQVEEVSAQAEELARTADDARALLAQFTIAQANEDHGQPVEVAPRAPRRRSRDLAVAS